VSPIIITGIDEAGRGPLAGPVVAVAVILNPKKPITGLADSKLLTEKKREFLFEHIKECALDFAIASADVLEIEQMNILQATLLAMQRAVAGLKIIPDLALIDGNRAPSLTCKTKIIVRGDQTEPAISAASILAKVTRDRIMHELDIYYPEYGFARHKGYPTANHLAALEKHGPCAIHRATYAPVYTRGDPRQKRDSSV